MLTCLEVAKYFLSKVDDDAGDMVSNLKLQKLVYYAQGFHLAIFGGPLFNEEIEAWAHGPVVPDLYHRYKVYGANGIPYPEDIKFSKYGKKTSAFLDEVYEVFGQYSAFKLRNMTHEEPPWKDAYKKGPNSTISHRSMREYFKTLVSKGEKKNN